MSKEDFTGLSKTKAMSPVQHIRFNPEDIMGCIDVLHVAGVNTTGMSLASVIRLALSAYLQGSRDNGDIPTRDGYEYAEMTAPFMNTQQVRKLQVFSSLRNTEIARMNFDQPASSISIASGPSKEASPDVVRRRGRIMVQLMELQTRKQADPDNFTESQELQMQQLQQELNNLA